MPPIEYTQETAPYILEAFAAKYAIPAKPFLATARCESGLDPKALNPTDGHGGSRGVFQFQTSTFNYYAPLAGIKKPDIWNPLQQTQVAAYMFSIQEARQWSCYKGGNDL